MMFINVSLAAPPGALWGDRKSDNKKSGRLQELRQSWVCLAVGDHLGGPSA
jgi:hypothetical protein